ncbi:MAG: hypothetical protein PHF97_08600 [Bacteroidales bacterium]|nr:hypothetical protein [Bacteroidales bacterium]
MSIRILSILIFLLSEINAFSNCNGAYDIWIIPEKYKINEGDSIRIRFGITGYGDIDIYKSKFCIYSEKETLISMEGSMDKRYEIFTSFLTPIPGAKTHLYDINDKENIVQGIVLKSDYLTSFKDVIAFPKTTGDKKLVFIFTYRCGDEWKTISKEFNYHVNTWSEENEKTLSVIYLFGAILTFLAFTPNNYLSRFLKWTYFRFILGFFRFILRKLKMKK